MVMVSSGKNWKGEPCEFYMNTLLHREAQIVKKVVQTKDFDYVAIVAGIPGSGKSNFAQSLAKFFDPNFNINQIAMTAQEFVDLTSNLPKKSAVILDESFASMNSRVATSADFLRVLNHIQLIRQRNLFVILCLPNFFDLGKPISVARSEHLFVVYGDGYGDRGKFAAYGRDRKRELYVRGLKYLNYHAAKPNFRGQFYRQKAIDDEKYNEMKLEHLREIDRKLKHKGLLTRKARIVQKAIYLLVETKKYAKEYLMETLGISETTYNRAKRSGLGENNQNQSPNTL